MTLRIWGFFLCCLPFLGAEAQAEDGEERAALEGTWSFVKTSDGGDSKKEKDGAMRMIFKGVTITFAAENHKRTVQGTYIVDPTKSPKTMDISLDKDGGKAITLAIYDLQSDTLKLCHYLGKNAGEERPKEFRADKRTVLGILKREKK